MGEYSSGSISVQDLSMTGIVLVDEQAGVRLRGFALAFDRLAKASTVVFNAKSYFRGFLLVVVLVIVA